MLKIFKKPVAVILEAIKVMRWEVERIDRNVRKLREMPETQTFTMVKLHGPVIDEWVPAEVREAGIQRAMAEEIGVHLLKAGAIKIESKQSDTETYGPKYCLCTEYRATIRVVVPKPAESKQEATEE